MPETKSPLVICFPDHNGKSAASFGLKLLELYPNAAVVPILNGPDEMELKKVAAFLDTRLNPIVVKGRGLLEVTLEAYERFAELYPQAIIVKVDTAEHPIEKIGELAEEAEAIGGFAVGDLVFTDELLKPGTPEHHAHLHAWPNLYKMATEGNIPLSGAHGFQAFAPGVLGEVLPVAQSIVEAAGKLNGRPLQYGFDGVMLLACWENIVEVERIEVPGINERNRSAEKILGQLCDHIAVVAAANEHAKR